MELSGMAPFSGHASSAAQLAEPPPSDVPTIDESRSSDQAQTDTRSPNQENAADATRDLINARRGEDVPTGPPPTFDVTILQVEADLQTAIARMEVKRTMERDASGVSAQSTEDATTKQVDTRRDQAPPPSEPVAQEPAERVGVAQLDQPYDARPAPDQA